LDARPCRGAGGEGGALSLKAPRARAAGSEIQPYRKRAGVGCGRLGDRSPTWGTPRALVDREDSISIGRWAARMGREGG
jgi:hypothetical protein